MDTHRYKGRRQGRGRMDYGIADVGNPRAKLSDRDIQGQASECYPCLSRGVGPQVCGRGSDCFRKEDNGRCIRGGRLELSWRKAALLRTMVQNQ